ncbi:MAG: hypothetical protein HPY64_02185 [Anaerolineae bacterium]|nr:hypothetical protein [Anaerolineae bacterium]
MTPSSGSDIASPAQVAAAFAAWERSGHAATYDNGLGADTTCARCKSPLNWDPEHPAAEAALDCAACKRIPGEARPVLAGGEPVAEADWHHIGCPICHEPVGDSYRITPMFWNQALGAYEPVETTDALCAHCHEGQHGFQVVEEMSADQAHPGWGCLACHDPHGGENIACEDCHDPLQGTAVEVHADHYPQVHCSACHDRGGLNLWRDRDPASNFYGQVITVRFAHTLTSWPSHNLQTKVACGTCHHARDATRPPLAQEVACDNPACHPQGAVMAWCPYFTDLR